MKTRYNYGFKTNKKINMDQNSFKKDQKWGVFVKLMLLWNKTR